MNAQGHLLDWLRDAHAMEKQSAEVLEKQAQRLEGYPDMQARIRQHVNETRGHADRVEECIQRLDGGTSFIKDATGTLAGNMAAMMNAMASDEVVKDALGDYAVESFEIACYRSLIEAANVAGDRQTAQVCQEILREEQEMAAWVAERIPDVTRMFLERDQMGVGAKR
jgi:ferritin-like metal-binding protein YciE